MAASRLMIDVLGVLLWFAAAKGPIIIMPLLHCTQDHPLQGRAGA